jgi:hypothetical protein
VSVSTDVLACGMDGARAFVPSFLSDFRRAHLFYIHNTFTL